MYLLETDSLTKIYNTKADGEIEGIKDISLRVKKGEITGLLGPNGAGKTTFIKLVCSIIQPDRGRVLVEGILMDSSPASIEIRRKIGYAPENPFFYNHLTGREMGNFIASVYGTTIEEGGGLSFISVAERLQLSPHLDKYINHYSQGMLRKLAISCAIAFGSHLIILDEPSNGLDPDSYFTLRELLRECKGEGRGILLSTHQLSMVQELADRVAIFNRGQLQDIAVTDNDVERQYIKAVHCHRKEAGHGS